MLRAAGHATFEERRKERGTPPRPGPRRGADTPAADAPAAPRSSRLDAGASAALTRSQQLEHLIISFVPLQTTYLNMVRNWFWALPKGML